MEWIELTKLFLEYDNLQWGIGIILIVGILKEVMPFIKQRLDRKKLNKIVEEEKLQRNLLTEKINSIEERQGKTEEVLKGIERILRDIDIDRKKDQFIADFTEDLDLACRKLIHEASINNAEFLALLNNGKNKAMYFFKRLIIRNIKTLDVDEISAELLTIFKELRNTVTFENLEIDSNKYDSNTQTTIGEQFICEMKNEIIKPLLEDSYHEFQKFTKGFYNGTTDKKFKVFSTSLVEGILKEVILLYKNKKR